MTNPYDFDPLKFIDREFEQSLFEELLQFSDSARMLAIADKSGMGKSELLRRFQYRCKTVRPRLPVALIQPDELIDSSHWAWVKAVVEQLSNRFQLPFPQFAALELARINHDFTAIGGARGQVDLRGANLSQAQQVRAAGVMVDTAQNVTIQAPPTLTDEQSRNIQQSSVQAFLADLQAICQKQAVVILLDHYEKTMRQQPALHQWLLEVFLDRCCFDQDHRPPRLILVLAGQELPSFHSHWPDHECHQVVKSVKELGLWDKGHVEACLRVWGYHYQPHEVKTFFHWLQTGTTPADIVGYIKTRLQQQGKAA